MSYITDWKIVNALSGVLKRRVKKDESGNQEIEKNKYRPGDMFFFFLLSLQTFQVLMTV